MEEGVPSCGGARGTSCEVGGKFHVKVVEMEALMWWSIHWWPCIGVGVPT